MYFLTLLNANIGRCVYLNVKRSRQGIRGQFQFILWYVRRLSFHLTNEFHEIRHFCFIKTFYYNQIQQIEASTYTCIFKPYFKYFFFNTLNDLYDECLSFTLGHWIRLCFETPVKKILFVELSLNFSISDKGRHIFIWLALIFICIPRFTDKTRLSFLIQSYIECKNKLSIIW